MQVTYKLTIVFLDKILFIFFHFVKSKHLELPFIMTIWLRPDGFSSAVKRNLRKLIKFFSVLDYLLPGFVYVDHTS